MNTNLLKLERNKDYCKKYDDKNRTILNLSYRELRFLQKTRVMMYYSNPKGVPICNSCGIQDIEVLCLDHIFGSGSKHRRETGVGLGHQFYGWIEKNSYPKGYQVLCANCNMKKK